MAEPTPNESASPKLVIIALVLALGAVVLVNVYIGIVRSSARPGSFTVFRLNTALQPGDELELDDVRAVSVDERFKDAFANAVEATERNGELVPRRLGDVVRQRAEMNEFLKYSLFERDQRRRLDASIDPGKRAVTLPVDPQSLSNLRPGMFVDLAAPFRVNGQRRVMVVMEKVTLVGIGDQSISENTEDESYSPGNAESIRIQVSAEDFTQVMEIADMAVGPFRLAVRFPGDDSLPYLEPQQINPRIVELLGQSATTAERD
jgi:Flp pilus assembly protein CpaB